MLNWCLFPFQVVLLLFPRDCAPHPQARHHIYSESDLLAVDSDSHSYSVSVAAPQSFLDQLAMGSQAVSKQVILPTPLPGTGPRQMVALAGKFYFLKQCINYCLQYTFLLRQNNTMKLNKCLATHGQGIISFPLCSLRHCKLFHLYIFPNEQTDKKHWADKDICWVGFLKAYLTLSCS